ncbi:MAG: NUDIX hydrolase [Flavobacteriales bacterium]
MNKQRTEGPVLTVDVLIPNKNGQILVIRRGHDPFKGQWCLPGGMVDPGETVGTAGIREVKEETGLDVTIERVVGIYSAPDRDPRGHYVSITLRAHPVDQVPEVTEEALQWEWVDPAGSREMAFDHARILRDHVERPGETPVLA